MVFYTDLFWGLFGFFMGAGATLLFTQKKRKLWLLIALAIVLFVLFFIGGLVGFLAGVALRLYVLKPPRA